MYLVGYPSATKCSNHLDCAKGDIKEDRGEGAEAKGLDDEWTKGRDAATGNPIVILALVAVVVGSSGICIKLTRW